MGKTFEELAYEDAVNYPYDENYEGEIDKYRLIARAVIGDLWGRMGVGDILDDVDAEIRTDIIADIASIIKYGVINV